MTEHKGCQPPAERISRVREHSRVCQRQTILFDAVSNAVVRVSIFGRTEPAKVGLYEQVRPLRCPGFLEVRLARRPE